MIHSITIKNPGFEDIKNGFKKIEGRLNKGDFSQMKKGDCIVFINNDFEFQRSFTCKITSIHNYDTFKTYLENETLEKCLPGIDTITQGISIYYKYYKKEDEKKYKIKAFRLKLIKNK